MDRKEMDYIKANLKLALKNRLTEQGPMNLEQVEEAVRNELSITMAALAQPNAETVSKVTCDSQGRITVTVQIPAWIIKLFDINNPKEPVDQPEQSAEEMMKQGEVGDEVDGRAT